MRIYQTPGVHHERADAAPGGVAPLRSDIAAFVGIAERGPLHLALPVESTRQFAAWFGEPIDAGYLAYCARGFFDNGGRRLWVVRVASDAASSASLTVEDALGPAWRIEASSPGAWGRRLALRVVETRRTRVAGRLDPIDPRRILVPALAGFERLALVELVRGADRARAVVDALHTDAGGGGALMLRASPLPPLPAGDAALRVETIALTIEVHDRGRLAAAFTDLSVEPLHARYAPRLLRQPWLPVDALHPEAPALRVPEADLAAEHFRFAQRSAPQAPPPVVVVELRGAARRDALLPFVGLAGASPSPPLPLRGGSDGLATLSVHDFTGHPVPAGASTAAVLAGRRGIAALELVDDAALLAVPDIHIRPEPLPRFVPQRCTPDPCLPGAPPAAVPPPPPGELPPRFDAAAIHQVQVALIAHCERRRDRFALLDAPLATVERLSLAATELRDWRSRFDTMYAALYAPWLKVVDPRRGAAARATTRLVPPSGHVAGRIASTELRRGVHVPPANEPLDGVQDVSLALDDERHGLLNALGVDLIRAVEGRGVRVLGARTLSSDPDWRFVNVRRLMTMVVRAIEQAIAWAVFEPNDWRTRTKLLLVIGSFLRALWQRGALAGAAIEEAFYVRCDESNNPPEARDRGELHVELGVAPVVPFEFIVLRIGRDANGFAITEAGAAGSGG
jgi:uncharacterized protein